MGDCAIVPVGHPKIATMHYAQSFAILSVPVSEFAKADGGVTCLALVW